MRKSTHNPVEYTGDDIAHEEDGDELQILDMMQSDVVMRFARGASIEPVPEFHGMGDKLAYEQFMQEPVVIKIHRNGDKNSHPAVPVGVNGDQKWLPRGVPIRVPRTFVERLAQCQPTSYETVENHDRTSVNGMLKKSTTAHEFPFDVIVDPSRFGARWLRHMMRQG